MTPGQYSQLTDENKIIYDVGMDVGRQLKRIADALEILVECERA